MINLYNNNNSANLVHYDKSAITELSDNHINIEKLKRANSESDDFYDLIREKLRFDSEGRCINPFEILSDVNILYLAYNSIKSNSGNMVRGSDKEILDGIDLEWFRKTKQLLIWEAWNPKPSRRVYIPKANGKMRPLGISSPRDKIIQQAMKMVLECVLEPHFSQYSHGFRPGRGCHTALKEIRQWKGVTWFVEGDIKSFFDNIDHHALEELLNEYFQDKRLINLYWKFVKAGYVEWDSKKTTYVNTDMGVPQGGIISPLLSNLILNKLDSYMENIIKTLEKKNSMIKPYLKSPKYNNITMKLDRLKKKIITCKESDTEVRTQKIRYKKLIRERRKLKSLIPNPEYIRMKYVRYADDWLIGIWGNKRTAQNIKENIAELLSSLKLELSFEKTLITNAREDRAKFLGTYIKRSASNRSTQYMKNTKGLNKRAPSGNIWMSAPIQGIVKKLEEKGFLIRKGFRWNPKSITKFTILPISDIILRYNSIVNGIANYYSFVDNRRFLAKIAWILKESLRKTISRKLEINKAEFNSRFGKTISINTYNKQKQKNNIIKFAEIDYTRRPMLFLGKAKFNDPLSSLTYKISTLNSFDLACSSCGSTDKIEMHHLKHIKTINTNLSSFDKMLAKINRKQVPLCRKCHLEVHKGDYQGKSLRNYNMKWTTIKKMND